MKTVIAVMLFSAASAVYASPELAQKNACLACHAVDKKVVGPAFKDVASKYASRKDGVEYLTSKIKKGGSGVWGPVPMPAQPQLNDADTKKLAEWVLKQK